jgi:hypothetical protein
MADDVPYTITATPIRWFLEKAYCKKCKKELVCTGRGITTNVTTWEHRCGCEELQMIRGKSFPRQTYEVVEDSG